MLNDFKPALKILLRFIIIYLVLLLLYQFYLNFYVGKEIDPFSFLVAKQVEDLQNFLGYPTLLYNDPKLESVWFYVKDAYASRMVEGCNAVSVMILFAAFVFAFYLGFRTFIFVFVGLLILHTINILRIVGINIIFTDYHNYGKIAHDYFFPAVLYGTVVVLWLVWINYYVKKRHEKV